MENVSKIGKIEQRPFPRQGERNLRLPIGMQSKRTLSVPSPYWIVRVQSMLFFVFGSTCRAIFRQSSKVSRTKSPVLSLIYSHSKARNPASSVKAKWGEGLQGWKSCRDFRGGQQRGRSNLAGVRVEEMATMRPRTLSFDLAVRFRFLHLFMKIVNIVVRVSDFVFSPRIIPA